MVANPQIQDAGGYYNPLDYFTYGLLLYSNIGTYGYVRADASVSSLISNSVRECVNPFTELYRLVELQVATGAYNFIDWNIYGCATSANEDCISIPPVCTNLVNTGFVTNIPIHAYDPTSPPAPSTLTITPGDSTLTLSWALVSNIFCYKIELSPGNIIGHLDVLKTGVTLSRLSNGIQYAVTVSCINNSGINGPGITRTGTPNGTCISPACTIYMTQ